MEIPGIDKLKEKFAIGWRNLLQTTEEDDESEMGKERLVVFIVALILALCLWLMVNLSREYNLNINLPIAAGSVPEGQALSSELPDHATVSVSGEGWKLINLYNNPPHINVDVSQSEVNLYDQVQQQMNMLPNISVQKVQPLILNIQLEERESRRVPVKLHAGFSFDEQYGFLAEPQITPDTIGITGARSLINNVEEWPTDSLYIEDIDGDINRPIPLQKPTDLIDLSKEEVQLQARVAQFTEGETEVKIVARNMPENQNVSFSPNSITVKFNVPIEEYSQVQKITPFEAYVTFSQIENDSTGFLIPNVERLTDQYHINLRSFQPRRIAYFRILENNGDE